MVKIDTYYSKIYNLREKYYKLANGKQALLDMINQAEIADLVYNSNAIENSTLSLEETEKILLEIDLDRYINSREIFEAKNLAKVMDYINKKAKERELDFETILFLHKLLLTNINDEVAGRFRKENEWVKVGNYIAIDPKNIIFELENILVDYFANPLQNIIPRIAKFHLAFENIHPFIDGNGRIGRVLNNYLLIREGFVPINIKFIDRKLYYDAFRQFDQNKENITIMSDIVGLAMVNSYNKRLAYLEGKTIINLAEYAKKNKLSHSNLLNKANRGTIPAFLEKGIWKISE